ncbi:DUF423 domain-containing protein [uncultured Sphingomonas sp.]|uniref:DUF423 domain-containing protein n=1 Tax=uncultured Sphingomonas sp. TaxID=158754 RepID=UPI0025CE2B16|nr:DUF423 domain-containing protein [uncultured Sphingomonas sp.]
MNFLLLAAALSGAMAVAAGAFGAHGASGLAADWLKTGGQYQLAHAIAALVAMNLAARGPGWLFVAGGLLFGGSLYAMALGGPRGLLGPITPLGGLAMILGWLWLGWIALRR